MFVFITTLTFSQKINSDNTGYSKIIKIDSTSKMVIYQKVKEWIRICKTVIIFI